MTNLLGYYRPTNTTEWFAALPKHITIKKVISVTNINLGAWMEYCNIDYGSGNIRAGCLGDLSLVPPNEIKVTVAYFV